MNTDILRKTILFKGLDETELACALAALRSYQKIYRKGEAVFRAGSVTGCMGLVLSGSVTIESNDMWGSRTILGLAGAGEFFAETYALLRREPMMVDVTANESCRILFLELGSWMDRPAAEPWQAKFLGNLLAVLAHKNLALSERSFHTSPKTARGRILAYLNSVSLRQHSREFDIPFDRQQMADYLNLERTALSKELGKMRREGILSFKKNHFTIL